MVQISRVISDMQVNVLPENGPKVRLDMKNGAEEQY